MRCIPRNIIKRHKPYYIPLLLYHMGMRIDGVLGLSWQDIDFAAKKINLIGELRHWQARQLDNEKHFGDSYVYIYREEDGRLILSNILVKNLRDEGLNAHSFRHTHATQLVEVGVSAKATGEYACNFR